MHIEPDQRDSEVLSTLLNKLNQRGLAYLHSGIFHDNQQFDYLGGQQVSQFLRSRYNGVFMSNGALEPTESAADFLRSEYDLVSFGRPFIANPDLVERLESER